MSIDTRTLANLTDGGPADAALAEHTRARGLLADAQQRVRELTAPGVLERAQREDETAVIEAAATGKRTPKPTAVPRLDGDLTEARRLVAALESFVATKRTEALAALAADAPRRREALARTRADNAERLGHLLREAADLLAESSATAATDALLEAIEDGVDLLDPRASTLLSRAATRAATPLFVPRSAVVGPVADRYQVPVDVALAALLAVVTAVPSAV